MIDALTRALLLKYQPDSLLLIEPAQAPLQAPVSVEINKQASTLTLAQRIAVMKSQGYPQIVIDILTRQLQVNMAKETK
ncbi:hypothetical protein PI739_02925 [Pseudomonas cerasi]|uniref:hypothetical protein n=1 Tax=Pseudomonas cerasi TaxID=1583341 RepID=UPI002301F739|nr:hypothetical protein [Pseudomonas cerasi]MDA7011304.1 hypothetical protein [Pseudomonas cerasi]